MSSAAYFVNVGRFLVPIWAICFAFVITFVKTDNDNATITNPPRITNFELDHCMHTHTPPTCAGRPLRVRDTNIPRFQLLENKTIILIGDSLTREWFETLSCALNSTAMWFPEWTTESRVLDAIRDAHLISMHNSPVHQVATLGYAESVTKTNVTLIYYHCDTYINGTIAHATKRADIVVANIGVHYVLGSQIAAYEQYLTDLDRTFKALSDCRKQGKHCVFRETLPQHFNFRDRPVRQNGLFKFYGSGKYTCGPIQDSPTIYNHMSEIMSEKWEVPVIPVDIFRPNWDMHLANDCTHFCQKPQLWNWLHSALINSLEQ